MKYDPAELERVASRFRYDMWDTVPDDAVVESGVEMQWFGPVLATAFADLPEVRNLNLIQGAAEPGAVEEGHLAAAVEWMRAREVEYIVPVASGRPASEEAEIWLGSHGYERGAGLVKFVRDVSPPQLPVNPEVTVYELGDVEGDGEGLSVIAAEALGLPMIAETLFFSLPQHERWRCYTAAIEPYGDVVACGSMLIHDGVALIGVDGTLETARGRGCNQALLQRRLLDAAEAGCHTVFAELGGCDPEGILAACHNLLRFGFVEAYASQTWQRPALRSSGVTRP
jgi:hypothetical protein